MVLQCFKCNARQIDHLTLIKIGLVPVYFGHDVRRDTPGLTRLFLNVYAPVSQALPNLQTPDRRALEGWSGSLVSVGTECKLVLQDSEGTAEESQALLTRQFSMLEACLMDEAPAVRVAAVKGVCCLLNVWWEIVPQATLIGFLRRITGSLRLWPLLSPPAPFRVFAPPQSRPTCSVPQQSMEADKAGSACPALPISMRMRIQAQWCSVSTLIELCHL